MRIRLTLVAAAAAACLAAAPAQAARLVTWTTTSRFVNTAGLTFNGPSVTPPPSKLPVDVYLPDGYDGHRRFPVLYLLHGHGDNYSSWSNRAQGDLLDIASGLRAVVVMPEGDQGWFTDWWNGGARADPGWESYYLEELMPLVERRLRILPGRSNHAIAGNSMGGEGATYFAAQRPGYFGTAASFSGTISIQRSEYAGAGFNTQGQDYNHVYGDPSAFYATGHNPTALVDNLRYTRVLARVGDGVPNPTVQSEVRNTFGQLAEADLRLHAEDFVAAAQRAGVDVTFQPHQGIHDWAYWREDLRALLAFGLFHHVAEHPSSWTYQTVDRHAAAWGFTLDFRAPPATVETFSLAGCTLRGTGAGVVHVKPPRGRPFTVSLPFSRRVAGCRARSAGARGSGGRVRARP